MEKECKNHKIIKREISNSILKICEEHDMKIPRFAYEIDQGWTEGYHYVNGDYCMKVYKVIMACLKFGMDPNTFLGWDKIKEECDINDKF